jgi:hypothetical protein
MARLATLTSLRLKYRHLKIYPGSISKCVLNVSLTKFQHQLSLAISTRAQAAEAISNGTSPAPSKLTSHSDEVEHPLSHAAIGWKLKGAQLSCPRGVMRYVRVERGKGEERRGHGEEQ